MRSAVIFDLDGTLVNTAPDLWRATNHVLKANGRREVSLDDIHEMVGMGAKKLIERGFERTGEPVRADMVDIMFRQFIDYYSANIADLSKPYPGVVALLDELKGRDIGMSVCTNKLERMSVKLIGELGLDHYFSAIIGPDTTGVAKPDPRPLDAAIKAAGSARSHAIMIGDSATDIRTAQAASVPVVAVSFGYTDTHVSAFEPDHVVDHFDDILPLLESYFAAHG
ncbi:MAG: HAD-IA family hydrolase [Anderseniella sp.]